MEIRQARGYELPVLKAWQAFTGSEQIDLETSRVWVAVDDDERIIGYLAGRLVWQMEPLEILPDVLNMHTRRRAGLGLYRAAIQWLGSDENRTGIRWTFGITRRQCVMGWLEKLGWFRQYRGAKTFIKYVSPPPSARAEFH